MSKLLRKEILNPTPNLALLTHYVKIYKRNSEPVTANTYETSAQTQVRHLHAKTRSCNEGKTMDDLQKLAFSRMCFVQQGEKTTKQKLEGLCSN